MDITEKPLLVPKPQDVRVLERPENDPFAPRPLLHPDAHSEVLPETLAETLPERLPERLAETPSGSLAEGGMGGGAGVGGGGADVDFPPGLEILPVRMVNEYAYCPRLFHLMFVQREWADNTDTLEGKHVHRRVDKPAGKVPLPEALSEEVVLHARSIPVGSLRLGATAVVDVLETDGHLVTPVDYKKSKAPDIPEGAWEPERVQVCLQALLLRENGYTCEQAVLYYAGSKTRVTVALTQMLIERSLWLLAAARRAAQSERVPEPLVDSPKCPRCSLVGICLPDEVNLLRAFSQEEQAFPNTVPVAELEPEEDLPLIPALEAWVPPAELAALTASLNRIEPSALPQELAPEGVLEQAAGLGGATEVGQDTQGAAGATEVRVEQQPRVSKEPRRMIPARSDKVPLYVQGQGFSLGLSGEVLEVREKGKVVEQVRLLELSHVALFGNVQCSAQALRELMAREIVVLHLSYGGWINGLTSPMVHKNILLRKRQFEVAQMPERCLPLARAFVQGKVKNARTLLRRNGREVSEQVLKELGNIRHDVQQAQCLASLLGVEGTAARLYFSQLSKMFKQTVGEGLPTFDFNGRNRRPPKDPVNAMLSYVYALLSKDMLATLVGVGLDPYLGFYHQAKYGRPALALDLMEEFRHLVGDSVVLGVINNGELLPSDFVVRAGACAMSDSGRKRLIEAYERRVDMMVAHPLFGYSLSYRRIFEVQARLLTRHLLGELETYTPFTTR